MSVFSKASLGRLAKRPKIDRAILVTLCTYYIYIYIYGDKGDMIAFFKNSFWVPCKAP